jgi:hypothetical protein
VKSKKQNNSVRLGFVKINDLFHPLHEEEGFAELRWPDNDLVTESWRNEPMVSLTDDGNGVTLDADGKTMRLEYYEVAAIAVLLELNLKNSGETSKLYRRAFK